jgi:hypothetical protein
MKDVLDQRSQSPLGARYLVPFTLFVSIFAFGCLLRPIFVSQESATTYVPVAGPEYQAAITNIEPIEHMGEYVTRTLTVSPTGTSAVSLTFKYWPPDGVISIGGPAGVGWDPPENPNGPAPYVWRNKPADWSNPIAWPVPYILPPAIEMTLVETLEVWENDDVYSTAIVESTVSLYGSSSAGDTGSSVRSAADTSGGDTPAPSGDNAWYVMNAFYPQGITMTTSLCQDWTDFLQSEDAFYAMRLPMYANAEGQSYDVPVMFSSACTPTLSLQGASLAADFTAEMQLRPGRNTFLANYLPEGDGQHWIGMGVQPSPDLSCPDGLNMAPGTWWYNVQFCLNLPNDPFVSPIYLCYEGEGEPSVLGQDMAVAKMASALGVDIGVSTYPEEGVTCLGPWNLDVKEDYTGLKITNWYARAITPTQTISFSHGIQVTQPMTVTLEHACGLGSDWYVYGAADLTDPITGPFWVEGLKLIWLSTVVPEGASGSHTLTLTATAQMTPTLFGVTSDLLWAGDWVAPPDPPPGPQPAPGGSTYLPLVIKGCRMGPDLVVERLQASANAATVVIKNQGSAPTTDDFWVDLYVNPPAAPTLNDPWEYGGAPYGAAWGVTQDIAAGESLTLTLGSAYAYNGNPPYPVGGAVYAFVDSVNFDTDYGAVLESNEGNNLGGPVIATAVKAADTAPLPAADASATLPQRRE